MTFMDEDVNLGTGCVVLQPFFLNLQIIYIFRIPFFMFFFFAFCFDFWPRVSYVDDVAILAGALLQKRAVATTGS